MSIVKAVGIVVADELTGMQEAICLAATTWYLGRNALMIVNEDKDEDKEATEA